MTEHLHCGRVAHDAIVADVALFRQQTFLGLQEVVADGDDPGYTQECRLCATCGTTLARRIESAASSTPAAEAA